MRISKTDAQFAAKSLNKLIELQEKQLTNTKKSAEILSQYCNYLMYSEADGCYEIDIPKSLYFYYTGFMDSIYNQYNEISSLFGLISPYKRNKLEVDEKCKEINKQISIIPTHDTLFIKLPRVPVKYYKETRIYIDPIRDMMSELLYQNKLPIISNKIIRIFNVFDNKFSDFNIPDNDNYDVKAIVDVITDFFPGGDFGLSCSFHFDAVKTDEVTSGTYIIVSNDYEKILSKDELLSLLKQVFLTT